MYLKQFGLAQHPFSLTPNTRFFLKMTSHQEAFSVILTALRERSTLVKITGEVGTGKTMLCRKVLNALDAHRDKFVTAFIPHPILSEEGIMHTLAEELRIEHNPDLKYYELLKLISERLIQLSSSGKRFVLFIDEAQAMPEETLKAVHLLTQIDTSNGKPAHVILFGQQELDELLQSSTLHNLRDEINYTYTLPALTCDGTEAYIQHRLQRAGYSGSQLFEKKAIELAHKASNGIPRIINILCNKAMMAAFGKGDLTISADHMERAIEDSKASL